MRKRAADLRSIMIRGQDKKRRKVKVGMTKPRKAETPKKQRYSVDPAKSAPRSSSAFKVPMQKPKKPEDVPPVVRWMVREEEGPRFDKSNPVESLRHFQEKVCAHRSQVTVAVRHQGGSARSIFSCPGCGKVTR